MKNNKTKLKEISKSLVSLSKNMNKMHPHDVLCSLGANKARIEILLNSL